MRSQAIREDQPRTITAKFSGHCRSCGGWIDAGTEVLWLSGAGVSHVVCPEQKPRNSSVTVTSGVFRKDGRIYVVKPNKQKSAVYAKEIVESPPRMTEAGEVVDFETVYRPGMVYNLSESDRWPLKEAQAFLTRYARCIVCNRHLKAAKSVADSIGPICARYFGGGQ